MTNDEFDRTARLWLEDGPTVMSDNALRSAFDEIHVTRQRRSWWPARRISSMNPAFRLAAARARSSWPWSSVSASCPGGGFSGGLGGPPPPPDAHSTATRRSPSPLTVGDPARPWPAGTYVTADPFLARVTFTLPGGWEGNMGGPYLVDLGQALRSAGRGA